MSHHDDTGLVVAFLACAFLALCGGMWAGGARADRQWEKKLVDNPKAIEAIRSRVLAERAEEAADK